MWHNPGVSNPTEIKNMKLNQLSVGTVFFFTTCTGTAYRRTATGFTNLVTRSHNRLARFPELETAEVKHA